MLLAERLGKRYDSQWIFRGLDFELRKGDALVVVGRNGSGKSTLLKIISGLLGASEGRVITEFNDPRTALGVSALDSSVYPSLTPSEHLEMSGKLRGCPRRTEELLERVGLASAAALESSKLSSGMRARLKLALAIQADPQLLILDEPGASLDEEGRALVASVAKEQTERGAMLVATNDPLERRLGNLVLELA
ncbi:MAG: ABC transporter ATP-binding protein [Fimbriimonadaceae bacterium]